MSYKTNRWRAGEHDEQGHKSLIHTFFQNCRIWEFGPAHILGDFKYRLWLGQYLFSIYEFTQDNNGEQVLTREYVIDAQSQASSQTPIPTPVAKPLFLVNASASNPDPCIVSAHVVLATLIKP